MRHLLRCLLFFMLIGAAAHAAEVAHRAPVSFTLDAPNGAARWSNVLRHVREGDRFHFYVTPLAQHLGHSVYATEIQVHVGPVGASFARMDPTIINPDLKDNNKLAPLWEIRRIVGQSAAPVEDSQTLDLGAAGLSLEDGRALLVQGLFRKGVVFLGYRTMANSPTVTLGRFRVAARDLPLRVRVIGYRAKFTLP